MNNNGFSKVLRIILLILSLIITGGLILSILFRGGRLAGFELLSETQSQGPLLPWIATFAGLAVITLLMLFIAALGALLGKKWLGSLAIILSSILAVVSLLALLGTAAFHLFRYDNFRPLVQGAIELERKLDLEEQVEQKIYDILRGTGTQNLPATPENTAPQNPLPNAQNQTPPAVGISNEAQRDALEDAVERDAELRYIGKTLTEAQQIAAAHNEVIRVVEENGVDLPITLDYQPGRINVEVMNGTITDLDVEGY